MSLERDASLCRRDISYAIRCLVSRGIQWPAMPTDFQPWSTFYDCLAGWEASAASAAMRDELRAQCRAAPGPQPEPAASVIDSPSVTAAGSVAGTRCGLAGGKKINGRGRHLAIGARAPRLVVVVTAGLVRDSARDLLYRIRASLTLHSCGPGPRRLRWQGPAPGARQRQGEGVDRPALRRAFLRGAPAPAGRRVDLGLEQTLLAHRPRLRTPTRTPRDRGPLVHAPRHDPEACPLPAKHPARTISPAGHTGRITFPNTF